MTRDQCIWAITVGLGQYYEFSILEDPSLVIFTTYTQSDLCPGVEKKIFFKNCAFSVYDLYANALAQEPLSRSHEINNLGRFFLGHYHNKLSMSDLCSE